MQVKIRFFMIWAREYYGKTANNFDFNVVLSLLGLFLWKMLKANGAGSTISRIICSELFKREHGTSKESLLFRRFGNFHGF